ncbi:hypothetical protein J6590_099735 [Homalodisca vitripennis]|nr:hypothetical protein J6590_099735 [Homalodisca vitripennis]
MESVRGTALAWFSSYFKERRQVVSICGHNSDEQTVDYGNYCYKLESKDPRLSFTQTGDQPDLDPSSSPGARHILVKFNLVHRETHHKQIFEEHNTTLREVTLIRCTEVG